MNLSDPKLLELAKKHPVVQELIDIVEAYESDPTLIYYTEFKAMALYFAGEMKAHRLKGGILSNDKDDKIFERIRTLMVDAPKIFDGLKKGVGEDGAKQQDGKRSANKDQVIL